MNLVQTNGTWKLKLVISAIVLLIADMYYLHITNHDPSIGIASKNVVFAMTSLFMVPLLIAVVHFYKEHYDEKRRQKVADLFGYTAIITLLGGLLFFAVFGIKTPPTWVSDLLVQTMAIAAIACIGLVPRKGSYTLAASMIFPLMAIVVYCAYRF